MAKTIHEEPKGRTNAAKPAKLRRTRIALIAHDGKKEELMTFVEGQLPLLQRSRLFATEVTGQLLRERFDLRATLMPSGPSGGDIVIGAMVVRGKLDVVVFLRDPLAAHPHDSDIEALMKVCDTYGITMATNIATAEAIFEPLLSPSHVTRHE